jgi:hypothetical protein
LAQFEWHTKTWFFKLTKSSLLEQPALVFTLFFPESNGSKRENHHALQFFALNHDFFCLPLIILNNVVQKTQQKAL